MRSKPREKGHENGTQGIQHRRDVKRTPESVILGSPDRRKEPSEEFFQKDELDRIFNVAERIGREFRKDSEGLGSN